jgi:hypothetical protein
MIKIKKHIVGNPDYTTSTIPQKESSGVTFHLDGNDDYFEIKVVQHNTDNTDSVLLWNKVLAANLKQFGTGADFVVYGVNPSVQVVSDSEGIPTEAYVIPPSEFIDIFADTLSSRSKPSSNAPYNSYPFYILVDDQDGDFSTWTVVLRTPQNANYQYAGTLKTAAESATTVAGFKEHLPTITLTSSSQTIAPNSSVTITVSADPSVKEVFIDAVYGLTNKQRVTLTNGTGSLTAYSTDLVAGEAVRVRAGYRRVPSLNQIIIPVE